MGRETRVGELSFTRHAREQMASRNIIDTWVQRVVAEPALRVPDPKDLEIERFYGQVPELDDHYIRVAVNTFANPWQVVTVFVDSRAGGRI